MQTDFLDQDAKTHLVPVPRPEDAATALPPAVSGHTANVLSLIDQCVKQGQSPEALEKLVTLYERVIAKDAESKFIAAKRAFQAECPVIGKNREVDVSRGPSYRYADLEKIVQTIRPLLEKHGFAFDFEQEYLGEIVKVTCHLRHEAGHVQATAFSGPWATNAGMSAIQKSASATTFCQRYALRAALGLPVGEDDDAAPTRAEHEPPKQREDAPKAATRSERNNANLAPATNEQKTDLLAKWCEFQGIDFAKKTDEQVTQFLRWASEKGAAPGENFNSTQRSAWRVEHITRCMEALP